MSLTGQGLLLLLGSTILEELAKGKFSQFYIMEQKIFTRLIVSLRCGVTVMAQTKVNLREKAREVDFSGALFTGPLKVARCCRQLALLGICTLKPMRQWVRTSTFASPPILGLSPLAILFSRLRVRMAACWLVSLVQQRGPT